MPVVARCRHFVDTGNKGPHFWDEEHAWTWQTDTYSPIAQAVDAGTANATQPLAVDGSSNTFTVSGISIRNRANNEVCACPLCVLLLFVDRGANTQEKQQPAWLCWQLLMDL